MQIIWEVQISEGQIIGAILYSYYAMSDFKEKLRRYHNHVHISSVNGPQVVTFSYVIFR